MKKSSFSRPLLKKLVVSSLGRQTHVWSTSPLLIESRMKGRIWGGCGGVTGVRGKGGEKGGGGGGQGDEEFLRNGKVRKRKFDTGKKWKVHMMTRENRKER